MKRLLACLALISVPSLAHAKVGFTWFHGTESDTHGSYYSRMGMLPSIDWHQDKWILQLHVLELIEGITFDPARIQLGANWHHTSVRKKINENTGLGGVFQPGVSVDVVTVPDAFPDDDRLAFIAQGLARAGAQSQKNWGFGIYVVPGLGIGSIPDQGDVDESNLELIMSGTLQVSIWNK